MPELSDPVFRSVETDFGSPSDEIAEGSIAGVPVCVLARFVQTKDPLGSKQLKDERFCLIGPKHRTYIRVFAHQMALLGFLIEISSRSDKLISIAFFHGWELNPQ